MGNNLGEAAGTMWGTPSRHYDDISFSVSDALMHATMRLNPQAGEEILDIATGTGFNARSVARSGAKVTGVDIAEGLLSAGRELADHIEPSIDFVRGDACALPFTDARFDRAISTFGIMFAPDQAAAASELARVLKARGRAVLACWAPDPAVGRVFEILSEFSDVPPPDPDAPVPMRWGTEKGVKELLSQFFDLRFETGTSIGYFDDLESMWAFYARTFGPVRQLVESLDEAALAELRSQFMQEHEQFAGSAGIRIPRPYLLTIGRRL